MNTDYKLAAIHGMMYSGGNVCFAPDGKSLLSPVNSSVTSIHLQEGRNMTHQCSNSSIQRIDLSADGDLMFVVGSRGLGFFYSLSARVCLDTISFPPQCEINAVKISPCGKYIAVALENTLQVYNTPAQRVVSFHGCHRIENIHSALTLPITSIEWTNDSEHIMIAGQDARIRIFPRDVRNRKGLARSQNHLVGHRNAIAHASFTTTEANAAVSVSTDNTVIFWKQSTIPRKELIQSIMQGKLDSKIAALREEMEEDPEGYGGSFIERRKIEELEEEGVQVSDLDDSHLSPVLKYAFEIEKKHLLQHKGNVTVADYHHARSLLAVGYNSGIFAIHSCGNTDFELIHLLSITAQSLTACAFGPSGDHVAFGSEHLKQLLVWDWKGESYVLKEQSHVYDINRTAMTDDGAWIISGGDDGKVKLWKTATGQCVTTFNDHQSSITDIATCKASNAFFTSSKDGTCRGFDLVRYRNFRVYAIQPAEQFSCLSVDPSGEILVAGCARKNSIFVFSIQTGKVVDELMGHESPISCIRFHPDGTTVTSGALDKNMIVWNMFTNSNQGERLRGDGEPITMTSEVLAVAYSVNGTRMAVLLNNGEISVFDVVISQEPTLIVTFQTMHDATGGWSNTTGPRSANANMHFTTIDFAPDGESLVAAGESKWIVLYHARQGFAIKKWAVTSNLDMEGAEEQYKYRNQTEAGAADEIDIDDDDAHLRQRKILEMPGSKHRHFATGKRKTKLTARSMHVAFAEHGREFTVASTDGLLVFSVDISIPKFAPLQLTSSITDAAVREQLADNNFVAAAVGALVLQDESLGKETMRRTPAAAIPVVVRAIPTSSFATFVQWVSNEVSQSSFVEHALLWAQATLVHSEEPLQGHARDPNVTPALKLLQRALLRHHELRQLATDNTFMLQYLVHAAEMPMPEEEKAVPMKKLKF